MPKLAYKTATRPLDERSNSPLAELRLQGFIDPANHRQFERAIAEAQKHAPQYLILDFSGVHYINSTGISTLIRLHEEYRVRGGAVCLCGVSKEVGLSMHLLGVTSFIPFLKDIAAAELYLRGALAYAGSGPSDTAGVRRDKEAPSGGEEAKAGKEIVLRDSPGRLPVRARVVVVMPGKNRFTKILRLRFERLNGDYHLYHDVRSALEEYDRVHPDVVVIDDRCDPKGEFVNRLKVDRERSLTSVIKIYGKQTEVRQEVDFKIWENDFLVDPFEVIELFTLAEAELRRVPRDRRAFLQQVHFEFRSTPQNVEKACKLSDRVIHNAFRSSEDATAFYAAVKEAIDNAVVHGNLSSQSASVDVNFLVDHKKVRAVIADEGQGFDFRYYLSRFDDAQAFEEAKRRIVDEGVRGGLGILLMAKCTDRLEYTAPGNVVTLQKRV